MRILLAAKYVPTGPRPIGGVQSWVRTVRAELMRLGHQAKEWQPGQPEPTGRFDLGIFANMGLTGHLALRCDRTICVSHGIIPDERPGCADRVCFVSEGVREHWGKQGAILRQPIDTAHWRPTGAVRSGVIRFTYRSNQTLCERVAAALRKPYRHVRDAKPNVARDILAGAALVFASGRAALEAMACGAATVIYDHRAAYQGPLMDDCLRRQMENSYSGRGGREPSLSDLLDAAERAMGAGSRRAWVEKHHDARRIVQELLA